MTTLTRRATLAALFAPAAVGASATAAAARPVVTVWHELARRAHRLTYRQTVERVGVPSTRRQLQRELRELTELVADMADTLRDTHAGGDPR